jgi:hypothetical protein
MGVLAAIVPSAQPVLNIVKASATEGTSWKFTLTYAGVDFTTVTGTCKVYDGDMDGTAVITLTFAGANGSFVVSATPAATAGLAASKKGGRGCVWACKLTDGTDTIYAWNADQSQFVINHIGA